MSFLKIVWLLCALGMAFLGSQGGSDPQRNWMVLALAFFFFVFLAADLVVGFRRKARQRDGG